MIWKFAIISFYLKWAEWLAHLKKCKQNNKSFVLCNFQASQSSNYHQIMTKMFKQAKGTLFSWNYIIIISLFLICLCVVTSDVCICPYVCVYVWPFLSTLFIFFFLLQFGLIIMLASNFPICNKGVWESISFLCHWVFSLK